MTLRIILCTESCYGTIHVAMPPVSKFRTLDVDLPELEEALRSGGFSEDSYESTKLVGVELLNGTMARPAAGDVRAEVELAAREKMREFINAMADEYAHEHFIYDPTTGVWEAGNETKESYELGLRDAAGAIARLNCEKFGHDWRRWNNITRRCYRCEIQEHGEHLRTALAQGQTGDGLAGEGERG